ncbi:Alpha/beta-glucosidase agdC [Frankliniella fusca]|uniref:Alpha/beta-glucosidase agdC n=1 Tax=Frankliniella fusca TaxID=407009 RepID=A0AAE1LBJ1_9NEOP|nr:Alpha/beta-glucosidase agdC [Frankliniella fusca]
MYGRRRCACSQLQAGTVHAEQLRSSLKKSVTTAPGSAPAAPAPPTIAAPEQHQADTQAPRVVSPSRTLCRSSRRIRFVLTTTDQDAAEEPSHVRRTRVVGGTQGSGGDASSTSGTRMRRAPGLGGSGTQCSHDGPDGLQGGGEALLADAAPEQRAQAVQAAVPLDDGAVKAAAGVAGLVEGAGTEGVDHASCLLSRCALASPQHSPCNSPRRVAW